MLTTNRSASAAPDVKQGRTRALCAAGGALAAALAWTVEVPLLGIHLNFRFGTGHTQTIAAGQVIGVTVAAALLGWLLLALLEHRTPHARPLWTTIALAALAASLALPLAAATTTAATAGLIVMHLTVGAAVIPAMAHTARADRLGKPGRRGSPDRATSAREVGVTGQAAPRPNASVRQARGEHSRKGY